MEKSEQGRLDNVRNDQSISEVRQQQEMINRIITAYVDKIKSEELPKHLVNPNR